MRKPLPRPPPPPPPKVVRVESSDEEVLEISSSSSSSSSGDSSSSSGSEADSNSDFGSASDDDGDALHTVFKKCRQYATRLSVKISLFAADSRMLEPRADAAAIIRPQPERYVAASRSVSMRHFCGVTRARSMSASGHTLQPFQLVGFNW